ncbi:hypothetical protein JXL19_13065 [bacterium]|nr:hypothetical protein [bacterium]
MKLALDSNVIIAAFAARALCHSLIHACLFDHRIFLSDHLLNEIACKLGEKLRLPDQIIEEVILFLKDDGLVKSNFDDQKPRLYRQHAYQIYNIKLIFRGVLDFLRGHQE